MKPLFGTHQKGTTLVEMIISMIIFTVAMGIILVAMIAGQKIFYNTRLIDMAHDDVRMSVDQVAQLARSTPVFPAAYQTNNANFQSRTATGDNTEVYEVRIMRSGFLSYVTNTPAALSNTLVLSNLTSRGTMVSTNIFTGANFPTGVVANVASFSYRTTPIAAQVKVGDAIRIDAANPYSVYITNIVVSNASAITVRVAPAFPTSIAYNTIAYVGTESRFVLQSTMNVPQGATNLTYGELRYYPDSFSSNTFKVLSKNLLFANNQDINVGSSFKTIGKSLVIVLNYDSRAKTDTSTFNETDLIGRGFLRYRTEVAMRSDGGFLQKVVVNPVGFTPGFEEPDE
ncbi:MAG: prepilin-type N-terminal cleavage/methylation domain-containing protein [Verrucomicrobiota bacterium]|nr:prepilin-type N-terminal cleavage/methylation domain-containing protein [Verrucomicrobiota bacterium]